MEIRTVYPPLNETAPAVFRTLFWSSHISLQGNPDRDGYVILILDQNQAILDFALPVH